tara:strand:+ start:26272 stop:26856 length:585 start_codon:yes stop_codon:yes gene_type:complete
MKLPNYLKKRKGLLQIRKEQKWEVWNPYHSKLAAYIIAGGANWPFRNNSKILYLGSAEGNTVSYLSEICKADTITAVEISSVAMAELLVLAKEKKNIIPSLNDAHFPEKYRIQANNPDIIYQDIAQNDQVDIFIRNCDFFRPKYAFLMLKTQSIAGKSKDLIENTKIKLNERFEKVEIININKWAKGHSAYYVE